MAANGEIDPRKQYNSLVFTVNYKDADYLPYDLSVGPLPFNLDDFANLKYACYQLERGGTTGTVHCQGYIEFKRSMRPSAVHKAQDGLLARAHFLKRLGTPEQARDYCRKEATRMDGPWEFGEFKARNPGKRSDLSELAQALKEQASDLEILDRFPGHFMRYQRGIAAARLVFSEPRDFKTKVIILYGPPGAGKSRMARQRWPAAFWKQSTTKWWDGYASQPVVIYDDFKGQYPYTDLLRIMDAYPCSVEVKGGYLNFAPKKLVITTNVLPWRWYRFDGRRYHFPEIARRIDKIVLFDGTYLPGLPEPTSRTYTSWLQFEIDNETLAPPVDLNEENSENPNFSE